MDKPHRRRFSSFQPSAPRHGAGRKYYGNYAPKDEMGSCYGDSQIERIKSPLSVASKREAQVGKGREGENEREKKKETKARNRRERTRDEWEENRRKQGGRFNRSWPSSWHPATCWPLTWQTASQGYRCLNDHNLVVCLLRNFSAIKKLRDNFVLRLRRLPLFATLLLSPPNY